MTPHEYEAYVEELISGLSLFSGMHVHRNKRFCGVRQPGEYEVDVALEYNFENKIRLFFIVECKFWSRPVGRDVIQRLVQTRDAIAAHKAIACSPIGFTREAVEVAKVHGVSLWVIAAKSQEEPPVWNSVLCCISDEAFVVEKIRDELCDHLMDIFKCPPYQVAPKLWYVEDVSLLSGLQHDPLYLWARACKFSPIALYWLGDSLMFINRNPTYQIFREVMSAAWSSLPGDDELRGRIGDCFRRADHELRSFFDPHRREKEEAARQAALEKRRNSLGFRYSLTETQEAVLAILANSGGPLERKELDSLAHVSPNSVGAALISLKKKGLVSETLRGEITTYLTTVSPGDLG